MKLFTLLSLSLCLFLNVNAAGTPGLSYNYYEGLWSTLPNFSSLTPAKKGTSSNITLDPRSKDMQYAFQWTGYINIPAAGTYTFETYSDDGSKLFIGSTQVVNNDGEHASQFVTGSIQLNAGAYPITISYFQSYGGQTMEMYWSSNTGVSRQKIADNVLTVNDPTPVVSTPGLNYNYYEGLWSTVPDFSTLTAVKKGTSSNITLDPRAKDMQYAFQWTGFIKVPSAGTYTFETYSDDGSKLFIGSTQVVNNDGEHASQFVTGTIQLNAGLYPITVSYFQSYGGQTMEMYWSSNSGLSRQKIADNVLTINNATTTTPVVTTPPVVTPPVVTPPVVTPPVVTTPVITTPDVSSPLVTTADLRGINNYYFSAATGDDARTPAQAQNPATPWKTLAKLNSFFSSLKPGDAVLFNRGETFTGNIVISQSGTAAAPIIFSAYGSGSRPVINGLATLKTWTAVGNGVYETPLASGSYLNMVLFNNLVQPMGRFPNSNLPNKGFLTVDSHSGTSQITDSELGSATNWTGAEIAIRKNDWALDRAPITAHYGNTLNFTSPSLHQPIDGYGYFIQNSPYTLDQLGEWYYNPAAKKLRVFFGSVNPVDYSVKASMVDTLVFVKGKNYVTFDNMCFRGADVAAFQLNNASNIKIQNSEINYTGLDGISADNAPYMSITNNLINHSNNSGVRLYQGSAYASIKSNQVRNSGTMPGMGSSNNQQHDGIFVDATPSNTIELNTVDSSGYCGIVFTGDYITVKNNVVTTFCMTVNDGGGIYTWGGWDKTGRKVIGNIVMNGVGAPAGTNNNTPGGAVGIYTDDRSTNIEISGNTVANCVRAGIYLHNSHEMNVSNNTLHNNNIQLSMVHDPLEPADPIRNVATTGNIMSSSKATQFLVENVSMLNDVNTFGSYNSNYYVRPTDESGIITTNVFDNGQYRANFYDLAGWTTAFGYDQQSSKSPVKIPAFTVNRLIGANKYANGSFNSNVDGVVCMSSPGRGTATFSNNGKLDGGALQVSFDAATGTNDVGTFLDFGAVTAGKTYLVKFSLIGASAGKTVKAFILQNGDAYAKFSEVKYYDVTTTRTENQFLFTAPATVSNTMIGFEISGTSCPYWIDNMQVYEAEVSNVNADDYMRFEYNTTAKNKTVTLSGTYVDAKNKSYSGSVVIAPFSSVVLMKKPATTTTQAATTETSSALAAATETTVSQATTAMNVKVSPNPVREKMNVALNMPSNTKEASMSIYSLSGVKLQSIALNTSTTNVPVDVTTFSNGVYIINIVCDGHVTTKKFVKS